MFEDKQITSITGGSDTTQYLKSAKAGGWIALVLVAVIMALLVAWSMLGTITITNTTPGLKQGSQAVIFVSGKEGVYSGYALGQTVMVDGVNVGQIVDCGKAALNKEQVRSAVNNDEYYQTIEPTLGIFNYTGIIELDANCAPDGLVNFEVVLSEMKPYELLTQ